MKNLFLITILGFSLTSCMTNLSMQTGRTLEKGEVQLTAGTTNIGKKSSLILYPEVDSDSDMSLIVPPSTIGRIKVGVGKNTDVGLTLGLSSLLSGTIEAEVKQQLVGTKNDKFAVSAGLKLGLAGFLYAGTLNTTIPLYASYHPNEYISFYTSPRFKSLAVGETLLDTKNNLNLFGLVNGLNLSLSGFDLYFEHSLLYHKNKMKDRGQLNAGVAVRF